MNRDTKTCIIFALFTLLVTSWATFLTIDSKSEYEPINTIDSLHTYVEQKDSTNDWERFTNALILVESEGDSLAVGSKNDVGVLQITPILIKDANRILGYDAYTLEDRKSRIKSIEIFNVIQDHYNPTHDLHLALKIWNSKAPIKYHYDVLNHYNNHDGKQK